LGKAIDVCNGDAEAARDGRGREGVMPNQVDGEQQSPGYGVDLITFYEPSFWGLDTYEDILQLRAKDPARLWQRILDALVEAGIELLEITFPPADRTSALDAFGSAAGFKAELARRGLRLKSGFYLGLDWHPGTDRAAAAAGASEYAEFIRDAGGDTMVVGLPMRKSRDARPPFFVDLEFMNALAGILHAVGDATLRLGVRAAVHTEAHSVFCTRRDIDLLLTLTDPEYVFFCPDTGHIALSGGDPVDIVAHHVERVALSHWKDAVGAMPPGIPIDEAVHLEHRVYFCGLGQGVVDWSNWMRLSLRTPGADTILLEQDAVPDPVRELTAARARLEAVRSQLQGPHR
jgi:sugar phosphate isomerase/epimerase